MVNIDQVIYFSDLSHDYVNINSEYHVTDLHEIEISIGLIKINSSYICLKRNKPPYENTIEFPGGKLESGETPESCLHREIKEELNIDIQKFKYIVQLNIYIVIH